MNDENTPGEKTPPIEPTRVIRPVAPIPEPRPLSYWLKKFLYCNPFYLASAALLLFGIYRVSIDPNFLPEETAQLAFNFSSLQCFELLLVGTAMLLARRHIWYDAKLLVVMENLLVLVPFILISQGALISQDMVWLFCGVALLLAVTRSALAQRGVAALRFPSRLTLIGLLIVTVNTAGPILYRHWQETKFGKKLEEGPAFLTHEAAWLIVLPALVALANLLPSPRADARSPLQGRRFPLGLFTLWLAGTAVHLYSLGYVYDFDMRRWWLAPAVWVMAWTLHRQLPAYVNSVSPDARRLTLALTLPVTLLAAGETGSNVFFTLNLINLCVYARLVWTERGHRLALHLAMLSCAAVIAALPAPLFHYLTGWFNRRDLVSLAGLAYVLIACCLTRNPKVGVIGGVATALAIAAVGSRHNEAIFWALQGGFVFFLLHSLRWHDYEHQGAAAVRQVVAGLWVLHAVMWARADVAWWHPAMAALPLLMIYAVRGWLFQHWTHRALPIAAGLVALTGPGNYLVTQVQNAPVGVLAIAGSFLLFAAGTAAALTRTRWHKAEPAENE